MRKYTIEKHKHLLAAWAASRAASSSPLCRFTVQEGIEILEKSGFNSKFSILKDLPIPKDSYIDNKHSSWRKKIITHAKEKDLEFTDGIAAKLINCYLKVRFVCGGQHQHARVRFLHPPIDAVLLKNLADKNFAGQKSAWRRFNNKRWSKFDSDTYQSVIDLIRESLNGEPLWKIEEYWDGHQ